MDKMQVVVSHRMDVEKLATLDEYIRSLRREMKLARPSRSSVMRSLVDEHIEKIAGKTA